MKRFRSHENTNIQDQTQSSIDNERYVLPVQKKGAQDEYIFHSRDKKHFKIKPKVV